MLPVSVTDETRSRREVGHVILQPAENASVARFPQGVNVNLDLKSLDTPSFTDNKTVQRRPAGFEVDLHQLVITKGQILLWAKGCSDCPQLNLFNREAA